MPIPNPVRLFHITAIDNLENICKNAKLISKNQLVNNSNLYNNIAHSSCQSIRARRLVIDPPGGCIHDYVPFYLAPRSPMLFAINGGQVANCCYKQEDIIHFELLLTEAIIAKIANNFVFYDRNATTAYASDYTEIDKLSTAINWQLILEPPTLDGYCKYFQNDLRVDRYKDRMEQRQAEFLIKNQVPLNWFIKIGVANQQTWQKVVSVLQQYNINLNVAVTTDWYFLGQ